MGAEVINSEEDLRMLSGSTDSDVLSKDYILACDIDLRNQEWVPIGDSTNKFTGTFDGDGFRIYNLSIKNSYIDYLGLFGYTNGAVIKNLRVSGEISGMGYVGFIAGRISGTIIQNSMADGIISSNNNNIGGLVGQAESSNICNSCFIGDIYGNSAVGGICGNSNSNINKCYFIGNIRGGTNVGRIAGYGKGSGNISNSASLFKSNPGSTDITCEVGAKTSTYILDNNFVLSDLDLSNNGDDDISKSKIWNNNEFFKNTLHFSETDWKINHDNPYYALMIPKCLNDNFEGDASYLAPVYEIKINQTDGGNISADKSSSIEGLSINLKNIPDEGYQFLRYNISDGINSDYITDDIFIMPSYSVTVSAEFELIQSEPSETPTIIPTSKPITPEPSNTQPTESPTVIPTSKPITPEPSNTQPTESPTIIPTSKPITPEPSKTQPTETPTKISQMKSESTDTGSGNYQYYPRQASEDNNEINFGSSPVVESLTLPEGTVGTVTLNTNPAVPDSLNENIYFEISAPETDDKISEIYFKVPLSMINSDKNLILCRVSDDNSEELTTSLIKINGNTAYFKAETNDFGLFTITYTEKKMTVISAESVSENIQKSPNKFRHHLR